MTIKLSDLFIGNFGVTQGFGENPKLYKPFGIKGHNGIDFGTPNGTLLTSCIDGEVIKSMDDPKGYGQYVQILHYLPEPFELWGQMIGGVSVLYGHLRERKVIVGEKVVCGQLLGISDNTGFSTGPHLHFGFCYADRSGGRLFRDNGYNGWQDANNKELVEWDIKNLTEPVLPIPITQNPEMMALQKQVNELLADNDGKKILIMKYEQFVKALWETLKIEGVDKSTEAIEAEVAKLMTVEDQLLLSARINNDYMKEVENWKLKDVVWGQKVAEMGEKIQITINERNTAQEALQSQIDTNGKLQREIERLMKVQDQNPIYVWQIMGLVLKAYRGVK